MAAEIEKRTLVTSLGMLLVAMGYAITRYVLSGAVHPENIPLYIMNKAISLTSVACLLMAAVAYLKDRGQPARDWGTISFHLAALHVILSVLLMDRGYYEGFYYVWGWVDGRIGNVREHTERMTFKGELTVFFGILGAYAYLLLFRSKHGTRAMAYLKLAATACVAAHVFFLAYTTWVPSSWNKKFYMPPISLLGFICVVAAFLIYLKLKDARIARERELARP